MSNLSINQQKHTLRVSTGYRGSRSKKIREQEEQKPVFVLPVLLFSLNELLRVYQKCHRIFNPVLLYL